MGPNTFDLAYLLLTGVVECITLGLLIFAAYRETSLGGPLCTVLFLIAALLMLMSRVLSLAMNMLIAYLHFRNEAILSLMSSAHLLLVYVSAFTAIAGCVLYFTGKQPSSVSVNIQEGNPYAT